MLELRGRRRPGRATTLLVRGSQRPAAAAAAAATLVLNTALGVDLCRIDALLAQARAVLIASHAKIILDLFHGLAAVGMRHEHARVGRVRTPALATGDVPGVADHELEVIVVVDRCRNIVVVVLPLLARDLAIVRATHVKRVQEFAQDVLLRLLPGHHVRMLGCIVAVHDVLRVQNARAVLVDLRESNRNQIGTTLVHGVAGSSAKRLFVTRS